MQGDKLYEVFEDMEKERDMPMSLVLMVLALLCGSEDQESVPVMSHSVLAAYDVSADIICTVPIPRSQHACKVKAMRGE